MKEKSDSHSRPEQSRTVPAPAKRFARSEGFGDTDYGIDEAERRETVEGPEDVKEIFGASDPVGGKYRNRVTKEKDTSKSRDEDAEPTDDTPDSSYVKRANRQVHNL